MLPTRTRMWLAGFVCFGTAAAHWLAYLLAAPSPQHRDELLNAAGHSYWRYFLAAALVVFAAGLATFTAQKLRGSDEGGTGVGELYRFTAVRLAALQIAGFLLLEAAERLIAGGGIAGLLAEPVVVIGLVVQLVVALAGALLLIALARTVELLIRRRTPFSRRSRDDSSWLILRLPAPRLEVATGGATLRGPPAVS